jgi:RNA polymerase sigma-70 factor (ECF subfamily)
MSFRQVYLELIPVTSWKGNAAAGRSAAEKATSFLQLSISRRRVLSPPCFNLPEIKFYWRSCPETGHEQILRCVCVRDMNHLSLESLTRPRDLGADLWRCLGGEIGERLIEETHLRLAQDRSPNHSALSPAAGDCVRFAIEQGVDSKNARRVEDASLASRPGKSQPLRREKFSRDCLIWISLEDKQKRTNCNSSCGTKPVGLMSGRNEPTSKQEKPADCAVTPVSPQAEGSTDASKTLEAMLPLVYDELRLLAGGYLRNERPAHTLQRTALVHEAYLRLAAQRKVSWKNAGHFLAIFARLMRQTLINHAVARTRAKRGGSDPTELILEFYDRHRIDVTAVDEALRELEVIDARQAQIVELRFFGGLRIDGIAKLLEISPATVKREWAVAKLWLRQTLSQG